MDDIRMEPGALHRTGGRARDVADRVPEKNRHGFDSTGEAAYQHRDLASGQALSGCLTAWTGRLQDISDMLRATGEKLQQAAATASAADASAVTNLRRSGTDLGWG